MPVTLNPDDYDLWLDPGFSDVDVMSEMLKPHDARLMRAYPVSMRINQAANDDAECAKTAETKYPPTGPKRDVDYLDINSVTQ